MVTSRSRIQRTSQSRVWLIENRAGPGNSPEYQSIMRAAGFTWPRGDTTPVRGPSDAAYGEFVILDIIAGQEGLPELTLEARQTRDLSRLLQLTRLNCPFDVQLHVGACRSPTDFDAGWEKIHVLEGARITEYSTGDLGALDRDQEAAGQENVPLNGLDWFELAPIAGEEMADTENVNPVVAVAICDQRTCGECGIPSDGCSVVLAVASPGSGSPGLPAQVILTDDAGATFDTSVITTLPVNRNPSHGTCVGTNFAVISNADDALHYAAIADLIDGTETWVQVTTGFVAAGSPNKMVSLGRTFTWIVGDGGYVYFSADITAGVEVQTAGSVSVQDLADIAALDTLNLIAVGALNAVLLTRNGGDTWSSVTGPAVGVNLTACWMLSEDEWFVGTANGNLWYTRDAGSTWTQKAFPGQGAGQVDRIKFNSRTVGFMSHRTAAPVGRILRTVNGGYSWYVLPEAEGLSLPDADFFTDIAVCGENKNLVWGGGTGSDASDGIIVKVA